MVLCLSACSAPQDQSAQSKATHPKSAQSLDPESYARHLAVCLAGGDGCNYDVLTATGYGREASQKAEGQESSDDGQNP